MDVGTTFRLALDVSSQRIEVLCEITEYEENEKLEFHYARDGLSLGLGYYLEPLGDYTRITGKGEGRMSGFSGLFEPIVLRLNATADSTLTQSPLAYATRRKLEDIYDKERLFTLGLVLYAVSVTILAVAPGIVVFTASFPPTRHSSSLLPQSEGEYDQGQANHHRKDADIRRQERHVGTGQSSEEYAEEHGHDAASGQQPPVLDLGAQHYRGEYLEHAGHDGPPRDDVDQPARGQARPEEGHQPCDDTHRPLGQRK
jgi:hypothetical protein